MNSKMNLKRRGFTLIELLIVVVIIGILAAIAIPKFQNTKGKARLGMIKSDLKNLTTAQEAHFFDKGTYAKTLAELNITPSGGVELTIAEASAAGWSGTATHPESYPLTCAIFMGSAAALPPATASGLMACQ